MGHFRVELHAVETLLFVSHDGERTGFCAGGNDKVILGLSGGVDSSVTAMLLHRAIGDRLTCVFVDNGLLRLNEAQQVMDP